MPDRSRYSREAGRRGLVGRLESRGVSPGTLRLYRGRLDSYVIPPLGNLRVQELTVGRTHRHLSVLAENHGPGTARTTRAILSGIYAFAAQRDALERNPVRDAGPTKSSTPKRLPRSLTIEQARQLRAALTYDDEAIHRDLPDFVGFMLATGCRIGEALTRVACHDHGFWREFCDRFTVGDCRGGSAGYKEVVAWPGAGGF